jgi:hypothetical protein
MLLTDGTERPQYLKTPSLNKLNDALGVAINASDLMKVYEVLARETMITQRSAKD